MLTYLTTSAYDYHYCKLTYPLLHSSTYATHSLKEAVESSTAALRRMLKRRMLKRRMLKRRMLKRRMLA